MRVLAFALIAALAACASGAPEEEPGGWPFPVERGSAPPPPADARAGRTAPPEGRTPAGMDFGQWRGADPAQYAPAFLTQMRARYANQEVSYVRADLEANGFACEDGARLDCRIEILERQCAFDWYVVIERNRAEPIAGYDVMCLGASR